ncbi:MAG: AAA family ATPase [Treponema sp.]|nr:AAA family ATPase [Treponema sp.]
MQQYFIEQALTYDEAERKARAKYGDRLTILMHETVKIPSGFLNLRLRDGIKITGIIPSTSRQAAKENAAREAASPQVIPQVISGASVIPAAVKENLIEKEKKQFEENKGKILEEIAGKDSKALKEVQTELKSLKEMIESLGHLSSREEHPTLNRLEDLLILNDFSPIYRKTIMDRARKDFSPGELENYDNIQDIILEWIGESLNIHRSIEFNVKPKIVILVGPTGVGKTTTVAKLAANLGINFEKGKHKRRVVTVTIDAYRIGAIQHLEGYARIMEFPCYSASDYDELRKTIALNSEESDLIIVDTIGKSPRNPVELGEMKMLLDACGTQTEVHLILSATTKASDINETLRIFEIFGYKSVIVTKLDETIRTGNIISALSERQKAVSYITNGQKVPTDICMASAIQFLTRLEGFKVNRTKLEERFLPKGQELMQKWR